MTRTSRRPPAVLVTADPRGDHVNVLIAGEINSDTCETLEAALTTLVKDGYPKIIASFENVSLITSAGLRVLLVIARQVSSDNKQFVIYDLKPKVMEIFSLTGFDRILNLADSYEHAILVTARSASESHDDGARLTFDH